MKPSLFGLPIAGCTIAGCTIAVCTIAACTIAACTPPAFDAPVLAAASAPAVIPDADKTRRARARFRLHAGMKALGENKLPEAAKELGQAIELDPAHAEAYRMLSVVQLRLGDRTAACASMTLYVERAKVSAATRAKLLTSLCERPPPSPTSAPPNDRGG